MGKNVAQGQEEVDVDLFEKEKEEEQKTPAQPFAPHNFHVEIEMPFPMIYVSKQAYEDMFVLVDECSTEVSWLGVVEKIPKPESPRYYDFLIKDILIPEQECHIASTGMTQEGLAKLFNEILGRKDGMELANQIRFWGHSHVEMDTFASRQDDVQMEDFKESGCDYFIRGILNKKGRMKFWVFYYDLDIQINDVEWRTYFEPSQRRVKELKREIKTKVKKEVWTPSYYRQNWDRYHGFPHASDPEPGLPGALETEGAGLWDNEDDIAGRGI